MELFINPRSVILYLEMIPDDPRVRVRRRPEVFDAPRTPHCVRMRVLLNAVALLKSFPVPLPRPQDVDGRNLLEIDNSRQNSRPMRLDYADEHIVMAYFGPSMGMTFDLEIHED